MRVKITETKLYKFEELPENIKEKAIDNLWDINVDYEWWDSTYNDADDVGLELSAFDIDRNYIKGKFKTFGEETASKIIKEHGENCRTYLKAKEFLDNRENNEDENLDRDFLHDLLEDYLVMLRQEYDYLTSKESIIDTILANDYEFNEEGELS